MYCLGIESTAHTFGASVVTGKGKILSNSRDSYATKHGGMIPSAVAEHHVAAAGKVVRQALADARLSVTDISLIAFSQGPGIGHSLKVGAVAARTLSYIHKVPIVGVNHCVAHLEIGRLLTKAKDPVLLYVSGANTQVIAFEAGKYRVMGETLDIGVGNFLDAFARHLGLGFPGGPLIEKLAGNSKKYIELPYVVKGMDVSFGGLLTDLKKKADSKKFSRESLCHSAQETAFAMLLEVSERALSHTGKNELVLGGGVACNARLVGMATRMCKDRKAKCFVPAREYLVDNAAMIAWLGILEHRGGKRQKLADTKVLPHWRTEQVDAPWRNK